MLNFFKNYPEWVGIGKVPNDNVKRFKEVSPFDFLCFNFNVNDTLFEVFNITLAAVSNHWVSTKTNLLKS